MISLTEKLKSLGVQIGADKINPPVKSDPSLSLTRVLDGCWEGTSKGDCFAIRKIFPPEFVHGDLNLLQLLNLEIFDEIPSLSGISSIPFDQFLFIDTETTGLSGGAGTYVFLIGAAKFTSEGFQFAQFFLQDPANELAQLAALEIFCSSSKVIISYNGKSFDLPRLKTRYKFHGWPPPFADVFHIDLLHVARRLWKSHLPSCSLGDIEHHLLGVTRSSLDVPGWKVASHYFDYLQNGDPAPLSSVFYHNEVDVISLITLLNYITKRLSLPLAAVILASHLGRPGGEPKEEFSLKPIADYLEHLIGARVIFVDDCLGARVEEAASNLQNGEVLVLENTRFHTGEEANDPLMGAKLASLADVFVNDAFGTAHRAHASNVGIAKHIPAVSGLLLEREINYLGNAIIDPEKPFIAILGGAKVSGKINVINNLTEKVDYFLIGGGMANTFFAAQGYKMGDSLVEKDYCYR